MWILLAFGSAFFAGITAILAKMGMKNVDSDLGTAIRTAVVLVMAILASALNQSLPYITSINKTALLFLVLSGFSTGFSWLFYFKALQRGKVSRVAPIDKSSTVLTMLLAFFILGESITWLKGVSMLLICAGTLLMLEKKQEEKTEEKGWLLLAVLSAVFAALTSILGKIGISGVDSMLGTTVRTAVVLVLAWAFAIGKGAVSGLKNLTKQNWLFLVLSGLSTGCSWFCYYTALQMGEASVVVPIDKLSIIITVAFSGIVLKEKIGARALFGLLILTGGTLLLLV